MKDRFSSKMHDHAFTLVELLVIIAIMALLSCLVAPGLARAKMKSWTEQCLNNKRQIQVGCALYSADNNQLLCGNDKSYQASGWMSAANENWYTSDANTNLAAYTSGTLSPYINNNVLLYRCPGDNIPSQNGVRIRSISMNGQVGESYGSGSSQNGNFGYRVYYKTSDFGDPSRVWVFCDESIFTINDGWLQGSILTPQFPDCPAAYHDSGNCFSFQDGHVAFKRWTGIPVISQTSPAGILGVVYQFGIVNSGSTVVTASGTDADWNWLKYRIAEPN